MSAESPSLNRHQFESLIIERAWKVPEFREEFVSNPKGTIEKYTGQKLPQNFRVVVHEEDAQTMHMIIPQAPQNVSELSDEDLERVAGGTDVSIAVTIVTVSITSAALSIGVSINFGDQIRRGTGW